jgi:hypothetical protein
MIAVGHGQTTLEPQQPETIVVTSNLVTLNVMVTDREGRYVKGLPGRAGPGGPANLYDVLYTAADKLRGSRVKAIESRR